MADKGHAASEWHVFITWELSLIQFDLIRRVNVNRRCGQKKRLYDIKAFMFSSPPTKTVIVNWCDDHIAH